MARKYKRMALEMHPDKGGDPVQCQLLQEMKERLSSSLHEEKEAGEKCRSEEEQEERKKMEPTVRARQQRHEARKEAVKLWKEAHEAAAEMLSDDHALNANRDHILSNLESFVQHHSSKLRILPQGDGARARSAVSAFFGDGLELIATSALVDAQATASLIESQIGYKISARSG